MKDDDLNNNHRIRIKERFLNSSDLSDADLLELLLTYGIPRKDTRIIAKNLLRTNINLLDIFTNIDSINAPYIKDHCKILIKLIHKISIKLAHSKIDRSVKIVQINDVISLFKIMIGAKSIEELYVVYLDGNSMMIKYELLSIGTINCVHAHPREIMKKCLNIGASSIILVHNHPSGNTNPSSADIEFTLALKKMLLTVSITIFDHLIISQNSYISMKQSNLI
jgi:DNA repair protein RadC